jgi:hypothetical protein
MEVDELNVKGAKRLLVVQGIIELLKIGTTQDFEV